MDYTTILAALLGSSILSAIISALVTSHLENRKMDKELALKKMEEFLLQLNKYRHYVTTHDAFLEVSRGERSPKSAQDSVVEIGKRAEGALQFCLSTILIYLPRLSNVYDEWTRASAKYVLYTNQINSESEEVTNYYKHLESGLQMLKSAEFAAWDSLYAAMIEEAAHIRTGKVWADAKSFLKSVAKDKKAKEKERLAAWNEYNKKSGLPSTNRNSIEDNYKV